MNIKNSLVGMAILLVVGGAGFFSYRNFVLPSQQCDICGRAVHTDHESTVLLKDGARVQTCCPRCALHYELHKPGQVAGLLVDDRATGEEIDARKALFVEGSDDRSCVPASETPPREPGVDYDRTFDRCLPSLVAFKEESTARQFIAAHGGRFLTYGQAVQSVKQH
jgi:nitrous oxide reductase accessory protein NosL